MWRAGSPKRRISIDNQTELIEVEMVSGNFFTMLGVGPAVGRLFNSQRRSIYRVIPSR